MGDKLRFGIMCKGNELPAAFAACVHELLTVKGVELALLILDAEPKPHNSIWKNLKRVFRFGRVLWTAYIRLFPEDCLSSGRPVDMSRLFAGVPSIACTVIRKGKFAQ